MQLICAFVFAMQKAVFSRDVAQLFCIFSYLGLHLPHPVDHKSGKAQWDGKTETLSVTLRMKRDYDFMNF